MPVLQVLVDERKLGADTSVYTRVSTASTAVAEGDDTDQSAGASGDKGTSRVALAAVLSTGGLGSADHVGGDGEKTRVLRLAGGAGDNWDIDEAEGRSRGTALSGGTPSSDGGGRSGSSVGARSGEADVLDGGAGGDRGRQLEDGDVVIVARVSWVADHLRDLCGDTTGSPVL